MEGELTAMATSEERRECEVLADAGCSESDWRLSCRECSGGWHWGKHDGSPRYCPHCGRKIAKVTILHSRTIGELVRCKDCRWACVPDDDGGYDVPFLACAWWMDYSHSSEDLFVEEDDFCSHGEPRVVSGNGE